ncbi:MAG: hypothetical protein QXI10_02600 [Candidatus Diapherotrites archaeon]
MNISQIKQLLTKEKDSLAERLLKNKYKKLIEARNKYYEILVKQPENQQTDFPKRENLTEQQAEEIAQIIQLFQKEQNNTKPKQNTDKKKDQNENTREFIQRLKNNINEKETKKEIMRHYEEINRIIDGIEVEIYTKITNKRPRLTMKEKLKLAWLKAINKIRKAKRRLMLF